MENCPCGSETPFEDCCRPLHTGDSQAETAEALMRARYAAFVTGAIDFLTASVHPEKRDQHDARSLRSWSRRSEWRGLEVRASREGGTGDERGEVEFVAQYLKNGVRQRHHEIAEFRRHEGNWFFYDGHPPEAVTYQRETPKTGRNAPCHCGSGKKFKKCCGR